MMNTPFSNHELKPERFRGPQSGLYPKARVTPTFFAIEACFRVLDSPAGKTALSMAFTGLNAANKLQKMRNKRPRAEDQAITNPLEYDTKASPDALAAYIRRARDLYGRAPSHPIADPHQLRGTTMAAGLLHDTQQIAAVSEEALSFRDALDTAVARRNTSDYGAEWTHALRIAEAVAQNHFVQVGLETMVQRTGTES